MLQQLVGLGILSEATPRSRWKIYLAGDLTMQDRDRLGAGEGISLSEPLAHVDREAIEMTLDGLFTDLDRLNERAKSG